MIAAIIVALAAATGPGSDSTTIAQRLAISGCEAGRPWSVEAYAVNPDSQTVALVERAKRPMPPKDPLESVPSKIDLVYLDLKDGREIARRPLPYSLDYLLALSRDGRTVVVWRQLNYGDKRPFDISVWKPYSDPENLKDYSLEVGSRQEGQDTLGRFGSFASSPPVISPDGTRVALFGHDDLTASSEPPDELPPSNAIGVLDLETGKVAVMPVPIKTPVGPQQFWYLAWSSDGSSLYAVLHGSYSEERHGEYVPGKPAPLAHRPDLTLYRFSLATKTATRVGLVPPTTIGFGPDDTLIVADTVREGWGPHRAFALLPIAQVEEGKVQVGAAGLAFAAGLKMESVVPPEDTTYSSFRKVFVGRSHTYAEVEKKGTHGCTALVERVSATAASE